jgi:hypothetical protein
MERTGTSRSCPRLTRSTGDPPVDAGPSAQNKAEIVGLFREIAGFRGDDISGTCR